MQSLTRVAEADQTHAAVVLPSLAVATLPSVHESADLPWDGTASRPTIQDGKITWLSARGWRAEQEQCKEASMYSTTAEHSCGDVCQVGQGQGALDRAVLAPHGGFSCDQLPEHHSQTAVQCTPNFIRLEWIRSDQVG